jgi:hypothetical protein
MSDLTNDFELAKQLHLELNGNELNASLDDDVIFVEAEIPSKPIIKARKEPTFTGKIEAVDEELIFVS